MSPEGARAAGAYVVDTIPVPEKNPYDAWIRFGGFDFFPDGKSAALSTWSGDVWVVSGIDEKLDKLTWRRFATGLFQPLGLKIVDGVVHVHGRDDHAPASTSTPMARPTSTRTSTTTSRSRPASTSSASTSTPTRPATSTSSRAAR